MFTAKIMLVLAMPLSAQTASETILRARTAALWPAELSFAVPCDLQFLLSELPQDAEVLYYHPSEGLSSLVPLLKDEKLFLYIAGAHDFSLHWDKQLYALWKRYDRQTLFTASLTPASTSEPAPQNTAGRLASLRKALPELKKRLARTKEEPAVILPEHTAPVSAVPAEAAVHLPALKEVLEDGFVTLGKGLALVCVQQPVHTMVIDPSFLFGSVTFLREGGQLLPDSFSLEAYMKGFSIYALHKVIVWPSAAQPVQRMMLPSPETLPGTTLARFEQLLGFHNGERRCSAKAAMGLFGHEDTYPQQIPNKLALTQKARAARMHLLEIGMPLLVSAFIDLPNPRVASAFYLLRFGFLKRISSLPITLYTGGSQERALRASFPNTQSYPDGSLLPRTLMQKGMKAEEWFARSKMLLLRRAAGRHPEFTHAAWLDMDVLPHPICTEAIPDLSGMMDDRIHLATVNGVPDPSFILVPVEYLAALEKLVVSITLLDAELQRGFSDAKLWERIFHRKPAWFAIHPMPKRRMLFLSTFDRELLSPSLRDLLSDLPAPYYAGQPETSSKPASKNPTEKEPSTDA